MDNPLDLPLQEQVAIRERTDRRGDSRGGRGKPIILSQPSLGDKPRVLAWGPDGFSGPSSKENKNKNQS